MKMVTCPYCGKVAATLSLGRPVLDIGVINVCDALRLYRSVSVAAEKLGCSRAFIYKVLKAEGLIAKDMIKR
jgi:molybdenum-dependent DNA-binding transcriptional regulator ModE